MQYSSLFLATLSATGALAAPRFTTRGDHAIKVTLESQATETGAQLFFHEHALPQQLVPASSGPFETFLLELGADVDPQTLRCKALDANNVPVVGLRGENVDITFSDAGKGEWTFRKPSEVASVICDPTFVASSKSDNTVVVQLSGPGELATQTSFTGAMSETSAPVGSSGPYDTIQVTVGPLVEDQAIRCQLIDEAGVAIFGVRGANTDTTFSDAKKGPWTFRDGATDVSAITCDPAFVANPL